VEKVARNSLGATSQSQRFRLILSYLGYLDAKWRPLRASRLGH